MHLPPPPADNNSNHGKAQSSASSPSSNRGSDVASQDAISDQLMEIAGSVASLVSGLPPQHEMSPSPSSSSERIYADFASSRHISRTKLIQVLTNALALTSLEEF